MAETLLRLALTLLIAAQGSHVTPELRNQAVLVANQAIQVANAELAAQSIMNPNAATQAAAFDAAPAGIALPPVEPPRPPLVIPRVQGNNQACSNDPRFVSTCLLP